MKENNTTITTDSEQNLIDKEEFLLVNKNNVNQIASLINFKGNEFLENFDIDVLKRFDNQVFTKLTEDCIKSFNVNIIESLVKADKIAFLPDFLLNKIDKSILEKLSDDFYEKLNEKQVKNLKKSVVKKFIDLQKFRILNGEKFKSFCENISFSDLEESQIFAVLEELNIRNKFKYLTGNNFVSLEKYIDTKEIEPYLEKLKSVKYNDINNTFSFYNNYNNSILEDKDIESNEKIIIKTNEIPDKIEQYLNNENYGLLKAYCIKCSKSLKEKEIMLNTLNNQLHYFKDNIYDLIEEFEIRQILMIVNPDKENNCKKIKEIVKEMNNIVLSDPDEFLSKINKYSEIINKDYFDIDFLEILAEENLKNIKYLLNKFYNGSDKNAVPNELKILHIKIINDLMNILCKKHSINKRKIFEGLQKMKEEDDIKGKLILFEESLNKYERLYYDLLIQTIYEQPDLESWIESCSAPIFKFIRNVVITVLGFKAASLTGSKFLTALSVSVGGALILKDIKDEIVKNYFKLKEDERRIYHLNHKNEPKKRFYIIKNKIKAIFKKIISPVKKLSNRFLDEKILHLKEEPKIGFEKIISKKKTMKMKIKEKMKMKMSEIK